VIQSAGFLRPLLVDLSCALFDGKFILTKDKQDWGRGLGGGRGHFPFE